MTLELAAHGTGGASFTELLRAQAPHLLPGAALGEAAGGLELPHGTTIVALTCADGIVMAGDRRATMGNVIANRDMEKVYAADEFSLVGIAGTAGLAVELVRLLQVELEHYEKIEGTVLSLEGKANRLAGMIRGNLGNAFRGLSVLPVLGGLDLSTGAGRIFSYDLAGGCYEESAHHSIGSGAFFARGALKKLWRPGLTTDEAVRVAVEALYDAADDDTGTGGPDLGRQIWPTCGLVTHHGATFVDAAALEQVVTEIVADRRDNPGGAR